MNKRILTILLTALTSIGLTAAAAADVISPGELILREAGTILPWLLVAAVVVVTVLLLQKNKKK